MDGLSRWKICGWFESFQNDSDKPTSLGFGLSSGKLEIPDAAHSDVGFRSQGALRAGHCESSMIAPSESERALQQ